MKSKVLLNQLFCSYISDIHVIGTVVKYTTILHSKQCLHFTFQGPMQHEQDTSHGPQTENLPQGPAHDNVRLTTIYHNLKSDKSTVIPI